MCIKIKRLTKVCSKLTVLCCAIVVAMWMATEIVLRKYGIVNFAHYYVDNFAPNVNYTFIYSNTNIHWNLQTHKHFFNIVWYAPPTWQKPFKVLQNCEYTNCIISFDSRDITKGDLVLFHHTNMNIPPPSKKDYQKWVFVSIEALPLTDTYYTEERWKDKFDWTMTFRSDSEGYASYGTILPRKERKEKNYTSIFRMKSKDVAWVVSNCNTTSKRMEYVKRMQQFIPVDIFGNCGNPCGHENCIKILSNTYKFYLSFENTICEDYVTEKLFQHFDDDYNFIPIVRGAPNVKQLVPANTFISTSDFKSPEELATYLKAVGANETQYSFYLQTKNKFISTFNPIGAGVCSLCAKLNTKFKRHEKLNLERWVHDKPCYKPSDL